MRLELAVSSEERASKMLPVNCVKLISFCGAVDVKYDRTVGTYCSQEGQKVLLDGSENQGSGPSGSMKFFYGSGSSDPYWLLTDPLRILIFSSVKNIFSLSLFLCLFFLKVHLIIILR
jgi:hypothetical protein